MKQRMLKLARNILISVVVLLVLCVGGGVAYTWYEGQQGPVAAITPVASQPVPAEPVMRPPQLSPNAAESAAVQMLTSPVAPGTKASVTVKTNPVSQCTIVVEYDKKPSTDPNLVTQTADAYGIVSWSWTVPSTAPLGTWPVKITCTANKKAAFVQGDLEVAPPKQ